MKTTVMGKNGPVSGATVIQKEGTELSVPLREIDTTEAIATGFRQEMLNMKTDDGYGGSVAVGAGLGTDFITLEWNGRYAVVRGSEILKAWVKTFAPEEAAKFPEGIR